MCEAIMKTITSKKTGTVFTVIEVTLPNGYKKIVFPNGDAERMLFEQCM